MLLERNADFYQKKSDKNVVVLIHGIFSSPIQFKELIPKFLELDYSVYAVSLLPYSSYPRDYLKLKKEDWHVQVNILINDLLDSYENVYVVSHSLGGALLLRYPRINELKKITLWSPALKTKMTWKSIKLAFIRSNRTYDEYTEACKELDSVDINNLRQRLLLIKPMFHLFHHIFTARRRVKNIEIPTQIIISKNDESVRYMVDKYITKRIKSVDVEVLKLKSSYHNTFSSDEKELVFDSVINFVKS